MKTIDGKWLEQNTVIVEINGKTYRRKVRYRKDCGLYIVIDNTMYFEYEADV
jgi:hypothetical protein